MIVHKSEAVMSIVVVFLLLFLTGIYVGSQYNPFPQKYPIAEFSAVNTNLVAIDSDGKGVAVPLKVEIKPGSGKVLTDIDKLLFWVDTQHSIQLAKGVAENYTKVNTSTYDLIYTISGENVSLVGGPSAGALMTIATIALLENRTIRPDVMMTGTINEDGTIGQVGGVLEKAKAARDIGAKLFLVPPGESTETKVKPVEKCQQLPAFTYCTTIYEKTIISISDRVGITVVEVGTVSAAINLALV